MTTFANSLVARIRSNPAFWADIEAVSSLAMSRLVPGIQRPAANGIGQNCVRRLLQSASVFSQAQEDINKTLAQDLAFFSAVASDDEYDKAFAKDIFYSLGNLPGADRLSQDLNIEAGSFRSFLRQKLLKTINTVVIDERERALTDFQRNVWSVLPNASITAISAPTSAGKSFVVLEYLCQQAISANSFTAVFIAPTRALLGEIHGKIHNRLSRHLENTRISTIPTLDRENRAKQIFVLTQERLQVLLASWEGSFDLVVVDEAQAIGDESRGIILQDCLEVIRARSNATRFLFLAPGASGFEVLKQAIGFINIDVSQTQLSPVVQNRIMVEPVVGNPNQLALTLLADDRTVRLGSFVADRGFAHADTRLAAVALELGRNGGSLVYGTGPANAELVAGQIASALPTTDSPALRDLSKFVETHVHVKYSLATNVLKGVGVHYGKMPSLLREALEEAFKNGHLKYLACTTTLFQGVNLPARNVFIDTPTRGRGSDLLDAAALWNFAGRAGRLGQDIVGNVFLIGYSSWETKPLTERARFSITPSFKKTINEQRDKIVSCLRGEGNVDDVRDPYCVADTAAGLLISRVARGTIEKFVERTLGDSISSEIKIELIEEATKAFKALGLPAEAMIVNWTVNPYGQARLLKRFRDKIEQGQVDELIPLHPFPISKVVRTRYVEIFSRINKYIVGKNYPKFSNKLASIGLNWMRGYPLPVIIKDAIKYEESNSRRKINYDSTIRKVFDFVEEVLRFKYVQLGRAYVDLLRFALNEAKMEAKARSVYDFPLALELGVSSVAGQAFIELGLSRITSSALESLIPDSDPTVETARKWLADLKGNEFPLSKIIWSELNRKGLIASSLEP
ncbi:MAG TPA: DEAD/DEAH box helicase [Verrucomicrobiae bacterium]|jgi:hypothetical protein